MGVPCSSSSKQKANQNQSVRSVKFLLRLEKIEFRSMINKICNVGIFYGGNNPIIFKDVNISQRNLSLKEEIKLEKAHAEKVNLFYSLKLFI